MKMHSLVMIMFALSRSDVGQVQGGDAQQRIHEVGRSKRGLDDTGEDVSVTGRDGEKDPVIAGMMKKLQLWYVGGLYIGWERGGRWRALSMPRMLLWWWW